MWRAEFALAERRMKTRGTNKNQSDSGWPSETCPVGGPVTRGRAVPIVIPQENGGFRFNEQALRDILQNSDVLDKPLVVVSVAGAFRTGKSFLLNFLLRYLHNKGQGDWVNDEGTLSEGFSWSPGCDPHTKGILVWDEVFLVTGHKCRQVAVLLMDTQGTFDPQTTFKDVTTIFALSALTSSVQVYNLSNNIREDDLQHLQYFIDYGQMAQNHKSTEKPFQRLVFLVRDWSFVSSHSYGAEGGKALLKERLRTSGRKQEHKTLRYLLTSCFWDIDCFLLPHPGNQVATGQSPQGGLPQMDDTFKQYLQEFVASLLAGDKLVPKMINGTDISCGDWVTYFALYAGIFQSGLLPEPKTVIEMTAVATHEAALNQAKARYQTGMEKECGENQPFKNKWEIRDLHKAEKKAAVDLFTSSRKMGGSSFSKQYKETLEKEIEEMRKRFFENNKKKRCDGTTVVLSLPMVLSIGGGIAGAVVGGPVGIAAAVTGFLIGGSSAGTLVAWGVSRATGKITTFREGLDNNVDYAWKWIWRRNRTTSEFASQNQPESRSPENDRDEISGSVEMSRPVQILRVKEDHSLELDEEALGRILLANDVKDKPVVVVSLAGAVRTGKSFLLDFFLRYMSSSGQGDWMEDPTIPLGDMSWREACPYDTTGIVVWEKVFLVTRSNGQQLAVLFMYTHGAFDDMSAAKDSTKLLALSNMTSSVQIYNLPQTIKEEDIKHLQFLKQHRRLVQQDRMETPFQELLFLVRDWSDGRDIRYGAEGGRGFLERWLRICAQDEELKQLQEIIWSCFADIRCFLLPHPGPKVTTAPSFHGPLSDIADNFKKQIRELVSSLLGPDKLLVKEINGKEVSCQELMTYFQVYVSAFSEHEFMESESKNQVMAEWNILVAEATADYTSAMEKLCGGDEPYMYPTMLDSRHRRQRELALQWLSDRLKMPGKEASQRCLDALTRAVDETFEKFAMRNATKMTLVTMRTPATLCATVLAFYLLSGAFALLGVDSYANFCNLLMVLSLIGIFLWSYARLSGAMPETGTLIENIAAIIWASVSALWVLYKTLMEDRIQRTPNIRVGARGRWAHRNGRINANSAANGNNRHRSA